MPDAVPSGTVTLVGGGPGDPDLMTVGALKALAAADVVLYDRLAPREQLEEWAPRALLIDVGKTPGHHAVPQEEINRLVVEHAITGRAVVRLKGGDPFVFGRGGEELAACREHGIPTRVVPGVTSAIAVPASVGLPVTHREVSRAFTVISGHVPLTADELDALVKLGGTIVVLMGIGTLPQLGAGLLRHGMPGTMPFAIIERGFHADQRTTVATLGELVRVLGEVQPRSPAVVVIGEVVRQASVDLHSLLAEAGA
ncbi:uroporphyrinogen-III C-methyltransferase [Gryllotalpicola reticulitermitis]|uniref:uroporphyrinogen-III C-methyltransferase n=1 Tax=Gryllotalpicola reticulitermitis TaxID=1184153 RepID=A0ABV8Q9L1_9MICO